MSLQWQSRINYQSSKLYRNTCQVSLQCGCDPVPSTDAYFASTKIRIKMELSTVFGIIISFQQS